MKLNSIEKNVLMVALDHIQEHLDDISKDIEVLDKLKALKSLRNKVKKELWIEKIPVYVWKQLWDSWRLEKAYWWLRQDVVIPKYSLLEMFNKIKSSK